jgi:hypothetical protein
MTHVMLITIYRHWRKVKIDTYFIVDPFLRLAALQQFNVLEGVFDDFVAMR